MSSRAIQPTRILVHLTLALGGSILVLAGLFYAVSHSGHEISPLRLIEIIKDSSSGLFILYTLTMLLGILVRAWRYQVLLRATGDNNLPSLKDMTLITAVRNMTVDLLPARIGELAFVALLRGKAGTHVSSGLSTLLFATILDVLILAPITIVIGLFVGFPNKQPYLLALIALFVVAVFILGLKYILPLLMNRLTRWSVSSNKFLSSLLAFILSINDAIQSTMRAGILSSVIGLTIVVRFLKYAGLLFLYYGMTHTTFPLLTDINAFKVLGAMIASEMTASLPIPALMSFGTWEIGGMTLLAYFGAMPQAALLTMLGIHIQTQALDYGIGLASLMGLLLLRGKKSGQTSGVKLWKLVLGLLFIVVAALVARNTYERAHDKRLIPAVTAAQISSSHASTAAAWINKLDGFIVWSSNRSGIHNIWLMNLPDMSVRQLTDNRHTENFARISPDGKKVVFARSHKEWQSLRDEKPWDIWMLDIESGKELLIAKWGVAPSWSPDGRLVIFKRDLGMTVAVEVATLKEHIYYESGKDAFMKSRVNMETPSIGEGQRMAFTFRKRGQPTNIIRDEHGKFTVVHRDACQVLWAPSGDFVTYVQKGGKQINQIMRYDPDTKKKTRLLDLPGDFSHEYFARLSEDERYMIFSASDGGHEHDLANYELFLWPMGADSAEAVRLTFEPNNDSWPDIWLRN